MTDNDFRINKQRAPRTSKACDFCKRKKLKCDGGNPCSRCQKAANECVYTRVEKPKPDRPRQRQSRKGAIQTLDNRIGKLEELLTTLVSKVGERAGGPIYDALRSERSSESSAEYKGSSSDGETASDTDVESNAATVENPSKSIVVNEDEHKIDIGEKSTCGSDYIGQQCTLSIFSVQGLTWVSRKSKDPKAIKPILNLLKKMDSVVGYQRSFLTSPIVEADVVSLPSKEQCYEMLEHFNKPAVYTAYFFRSVEMKDIVDRYFKLQETNPFGKLDHADMLNLYLMIVCGSCHKAEQAASENKTEDVAKYQKMEHTYLIGAFYYYQRVSIFGGGIDGLKAILLLTCYCELSLIPEIDYILVSTAVRFAQALGLHRRETFLGLSPDEAVLRKRLWFLCYILDRDLCLKSGKPPMINDDDMSSIDTEGMASYCEDLKVEVALSIGITRAELDMDNIDHCYRVYSALGTISETRYCMGLEYTWYELSKITSKAYKTLFSANSLDGLTRIDVLRKIGSLNEELEKFKMKFPIILRPGHPIRIPTSLPAHDLDYLKLVRVHLSYYLICLSVNRMALRKQWDYTNTRGQSAEPLSNEGNNERSILENKFSHLCIDACYEIMKLCDEFTKENFNLWIGSAFTLFSAYVTCLTYSIENPQGIETKNILKKMINTLSDNGTDYKPVFPTTRIDIINYIKVHGMRFALSIFTKIALKLYNEHNPDQQIIGEEVSKLDQNTVLLGSLLSRCIEDYRYQQENNNSFDRFGVILSGSSIGEVLSKLNHKDSSSSGSTPTSNTSISTDTPNSWAYFPGTTENPKSGPHFPSYGREILRPDTKTRLNLFNDGNLLYDQLGGFNQQNVGNSQFPQTNPSISNQVNGSNQAGEPPSIEEVLDTSDLHINWNYFGHNLLNIPISFTDEISTALPNITYE